MKKDSKSGQKESSSKKVFNIYIISLLIFLALALYVLFAYEVLQVSCLYHQNSLIHKILNGAAFLFSLVISFFSGHMVINFWNLKRKFIYTVCIPTFFIGLSAAYIIFLEWLFYCLFDGLGDALLPLYDLH